MCIVVILTAVSADINWCHEDFYGNVIWCARKISVKKSSLSQVRSADEKTFSCFIFFSFHSFWLWCGFYHKGNCQNFSLKKPNRKSRRKKKLFLNRKTWFPITKLRNLSTKKPQQNCEENMTQNFAYEWMLKGFRLDEEVL